MYFGDNNKTIDHSLFYLQLYICSPYGVLTMFLLGQTVLSLSFGVVLTSIVVYKKL